MTADRPVHVKAAPGPNVPVEILRHIVSYLSTSTLPSVMRTSKVMHDIAALYLYRVIQIPPEPSAGGKHNELTPAPRYVSLARRLEIHAKPRPIPKLWATCSPRVVRVDDKIRIARYFDYGHLESIVIDPLRSSSSKTDRWRWMREKSLRMTYICTNPLDLFRPIILPDRRTPPDPRIGPQTKSLTIIFAPTLKRRGQRTVVAICPVLRKRLSWLEVIARYLCALPPDIPVTLVGLTEYERQRSRVIYHSAQVAFEMIQQGIADQVTAVCEMHGRKEDDAAILKRLRLLDMRTWVEEELDEADISKAEARTWVTHVGLATSRRSFRSWRS